MTVSRFAPWLAVLTAGATVLAACGAGSATPTAPSAAGPRSGVWRGTLNDANGPTGTLRLTLDERQVDATRSLVSGTWTASFEDRSRDGAGTLSGVITNAVGSMMLVPTTPHTCDRVFAVTAGTISTPQLAISARSMEGPYSQALCPGTATGTLTLTKQ